MMIDSDAVVIAARSLTYRYPSTDRPALDHFDLDVRAGEYLALLGANGSGKSTFLKLLVGLLAPDSGTVRVCGESTPREFRRRVAVVLQNPDDQIVATVAEEDVAFGPENLGLPPEEIERRVTASLRAVGLESSRRKPPHFLSGGERQRLALAGALAMEAPILALDEASSMIDPSGRGAFLDLLDVFVAEGKTVLHVTHSMEDASRASRVVVLDHGRPAYDGTPAELFERPELEDWGLEPPQAVVCARALKRHGLSVVPQSLDPEGFAACLAEIAPIGAGSAQVPDLPLSSSAGRIVLRFEGASHTYMRGTAFSSTAMRDVDLSIARGRSVAVVGASGSGKSTLLRHGNAVLLPQEGRVLVFGDDTLDPAVPLRPLRSRAALSVQNPEAALFSRYVADDVAYGPRNKGLSGRTLVASVRTAMDRAGLNYSEYRDRETTTLSGGEKRKAALAGVFALEAELYLLDEPSAALDPVSRRKLLDGILLMPGGGTSLVATTHSMEEAVRFDRVVVMKNGGIVAEGSPREIFYDRYDETWGIGLPWAAAVSRALTTRGISMVGSPLDAEELALDLCGAAVPAETASRIPEDSSSPALEPKRRRGKRRGAGIEFFRNAVIGQFLDRPSAIRSLSPTLKYSGLIALILLSTIGDSPLLSLSTLAVTLILGGLARIGPRHLLRGVVPALPYLALIVVFQLAFSWPGDESEAVFLFGPLDVTTNELRRAFLLLVRFIALLSELSLFSAVTPLSEAVGGVETALSPLGKIGFPVRDFSMIAAVALRFVPVLAEEAERIATAQLSRGGGYSGKGRVRAGLALTVPLFLRSLERAEALATAMELRLYGIDRA